MESPLRSRSLRSSRGDTTKAAEGITEAIKEAAKVTENITKVAETVTEATEATGNTIKLGWSTPLRSRRPPSKVTKLTKLTELMEN